MQKFRTGAKLPFLCTVHVSVDFLTFGSFLLPFPILPSLYNAFLRVCWYFTLFGALISSNLVENETTFNFWLLVEIQSTVSSLAFLCMLHFLCFSFIFSATKQPSEDDNSEDGWLYRFSP